MLTSIIPNSCRYEAIIPILTKLCAVVVVLFHIVGFDVSASFFGPDLLLLCYR